MAEEVDSNFQYRSANTQTNCCSRARHLYWVDGSILRLSAPAVVKGCDHKTHDWDQDPMPRALAARLLRPLAWLNSSARLTTCCFPIARARPSEALGFWLSPKKAQSGGDGEI